MEISKKIKQLRQQKELSQKELAKLIGASTMAISNYELGKNFPDQEKLQKISKALGVTIADFYDGERKTVDNSKEESYRKLVDTHEILYKQISKDNERLQKENEKLRSELIKLELKKLQK